MFMSYREYIIRSKSSSILGLGAMLNYLAIVELWVIGYFLSCGVTNCWATFRSNKVTESLITSLNHFEFEKSSLHLHETLLVVHGAL